MKVNIKRIDVNMDLGNNGLEFEVKDTDGKHLGDLRVGKATIEWCKGKKPRGRGVKKSWDELIKWLQPEA